MILWKFTLREIKSRPGRALLTLLSIMIGVAAVVAVSVSTATTHRAYQEMYESVTGRAALEVVAEGGGTFPQSVVPLLEEIPGVRAAVPLVQQPSILYVKDHRVRLLVLGIDPDRDEAARDYDLQEGTFFESDGALLEVGLARSLGIGVHDNVRLLTRGGVEEIAVVGLLAPRGAAGFNQGGIVFLPLHVAQSFYGRRNSINTASLVLEDGADEQAVKAAIVERLPAGLSVRTPAGRTQLAKQTLQDAEYGLTFAYALILVLACFMILNTFLMNVQERRRQLAVLRALGTTRGQVTGMLLREGLVLGTLGTVLGSLIGLGGAHLLAAAMAQVYSAAIPAIHLSWPPFLLAALLGPGISLVAIYVPARLAGRVSPLEGMRPAVVEEEAPVPRGFAAAAFVVFALTGVLLAACVAGYLPMVMSVYAGAAFTAAFILLIPVVLRPLSRAVADALSPVLGPEGRLAQRQVIRRRARTALTIGLLYVAVSSGVGLGTTILSNVADVRAWQQRTIVGDFFVRAMFPDLATGQAAELPESLGPQIAAIDGVTSVNTLRFVSATVGEEQVVVALREFGGQDDLPLDLRVGQPEEVRRRLLQGDVVIGTVLAKRAGVGVGDTITLDTRAGKKQLRVAGTTTEYLVGGLVVHMEREFGKRLFAVEGVDAFMVKARSDALAGVETQLKAICDQRGLMLHGFADLRRRLDSLMNGVVGSLWGLLGLGYVVAGFAIANTLTMNVLEQTRDLALLRVITMTSRQVRKTILSQAAIIGFIGLVTGIAGGLAGAYIINLVMAAALGRPVQFAVYPGLILATFAAGLALVLVAAWAPAHRAARLNLLIALHYE